MTDDTRSQGSPFAVSGTLLLLVTTAVSLYLLQAPLSSSRPPAPLTVRGEASGDAPVEARLWQDPFKPVTDYRSSHPYPVATPPWLRRFVTSAWGIEPSAKGDPKADRQSVKHVHDQLLKGPRTLLLPVMISGRPYAEDGETRLRTRYAILAALNVAGYVPEDGEHVGICAVDWPYRDATPRRLNANPARPDDGLNIPYEWFRVGEWQRNHAWNRVLVLWLDNDAFADAPLTRMAQLLELIREPPDRVGTAPSTQPDAQAVRVLGPADSPTLKALLADRIICPDAASECDRCRLKQLGSQFDNAEFYSPRATAAPAFLESIDSSEWRLKLGTRGMMLHRTTATDFTLCGALVDELKNRNVDPADHQNHVVLVSEWDTNYGRALPLTFSAIAAGARGGTDPSFDDTIRTYLGGAPLPENIHCFSYLRGVDGRSTEDRVAGTGRTSSSSQGGTASKDSADDKTSSAEDNQERPDGTAQLDYMRRLAAEVRRLNHQLAISGNGHVRAIGVLGSDMYDKLLVLRALRDDFPDAVFFTTDLDNRLLQSRELQWTRGLLVASGFGLQLAERISVSKGHPDRPLQGGIPPFRDAYQTAMFGSCLLAVEHLSREEWTRRGDPVENPRLFVVGRTGEVDLSPTTGLRGAKDESYQATGGNSVHALPRPDPPQSPWWWLAIVAFLGSGAVMIIATTPGLRRLFFRTGPVVINPRRTRSQHISSDRRGLLNRACDALEADCDRQERASSIGLALVAAAILLLFGWTVYHANHTDGEEPLRVLDGISVWPTEYLRLIALLTSVGFLFRMRYELHRNNISLARTYMLRPPRFIHRQNAVGTRIRPWRMMYRRTRAIGRMLIKSMARRVGGGDARIDQASPAPPAADAPPVREETVNAANNVADVARGVSHPEITAAVRAMKRAAQIISQITKHRPLGIVIEVVVVKRDGTTLSQDVKVAGSLKMADGGDGARGPGGAATIVASAERTSTVQRIVSEEKQSVSAAHAQRELPACVKNLSLGNRAKAILPFLLNRTVESWEHRPPPRRADFLWPQYLRHAFIWARIWRIGLQCLIYLFFASAVFELSDVYYQCPGRGWWAHGWNAALLISGTIALAVLIFFVVDATRLCEVLSRKLAGAGMPWHRELLREQSHRRNVDPHLLGDFLDVRFIADQTKVVGRLIFYPFVVLFVLIVARMNVFDRWDWSPALLIVYGVNALYAAGSAVLLNRSAERVRAAAIANLNRKLVAAKGRPDDNRSITLCNQIPLLIEEIRGIQDGAFAPLSKNPVVQSVLLPLSGLGTLKVLESLALGH